MHANMPLSAALICLALAPGCFSVDDTPRPPLDGSSGEGEGTTHAEPMDGGSGTGTTGSDPTTGGGDEGSTGAPVDDDDTSSGGGDSTGSAAAPTVLEVLPENGATGVLADQALVFRFGTPMDKAATQAAYQSADIPAGAVTFQWNDAGDELTITPNSPLDYAEGDDLDDTDAHAYTFTLTSAAESEDGLPLAEDLTFTFTTMRRVSLTLERDGDLSGRVRDLAGASSGLSTYTVGDNPSNDPSRGFLTFDVSQLPGTLELEEASLHAEFSSVLGNPFGGFGAVLLYLVSFDTFDDPLFDTPTIGSHTGLFGTMNDDIVDRDVTAMTDTALGDPDGFGGRVQFSLRWAPTETDGDGQTDAVTVRAYEARLDLRILTP